MNAIWNSWGKRIVGGVLVVAVVAVSLGIGHGTPRRHMPRVLGDSKAIAVKKMSRHDLVPEISMDRSARRRLPSRWAGRVVQQTWAHGMALAKGSTVKITVYPGEPDGPARAPRERTRSSAG